MYDHSKNSVRPAPETKDAFARTVNDGAAFLRAKGQEKLAQRLEAILAQYEQVKPAFNRTFTAAFGSMLSYIRINCIHFEQKGRGLYEARHGRSGTGDLLYAITNKVAPHGVMVGDTAADEIDELYASHAQIVAKAIAAVEDPGAVLAAIDYTIEELRKESPDYRRIQQMSCFRALLRELIGGNSGYINTLRRLPPEYEFELLADLEGLTWHLQHKGLYAEAVALSNLTLDCAVQLCGSTDERTIPLYTSFAQILAESGDFNGAAKYGFEPLKVLAKTAIAAFQDADQKTQWQNKEIDTFLTMLTRYVDLLKMAPYRQTQEITDIGNAGFWWHFKTARKLLSLLEEKDGKVSTGDKRDALLPLLTDAA
jgi:hypothetical protein